MIAEFCHMRAYVRACIMNRDQSALPHILCCAVLGGSFSAQLQSCFGLISAVAPYHSHSHCAITHTHIQTSRTGFVINSLLLTCNSSNKKICLYLTILSHSRGTDFGSHGDESEKVELLEQRVQLSREMSSLRLAVTQLERDMTRLRGDVSDMGEGRVVDNCHLISYLLVLMSV